MPAGRAAVARREVRVLVIEDDPASHDLLRRLLERNSIVALGARTGSDGLRTLFEQRPDLVLLDVGLPDADGPGVLSRIREMTDVPVVMLSAHDDESTKVRALRAGADDYVTKPFGLQELIARIDALLRRSLTASGLSGRTRTGWSPWTTRRSR